MKNLVTANKELNKWCGTQGINYYEGIEALGFLFKYAVPKLIERGYSLRHETALAEEPWYWWIIEKGDNLWKVDNPNPALALSRAIYKVIKGSDIEL